MDLGSIIQTLNQVAIQVMPTLLMAMMITVMLCTIYIAVKTAKNQKAPFKETKEQQSLEVKQLIEETEKTSSMENIEVGEVQEGKEHIEEVSPGQEQRETMGQEPQEAIHKEEQQAQAKTKEGQAQESTISITEDKAKEMAEVSKKLPVSKITFKEIEEAKKEEKQEAHEEIEKAEELKPQAEAPKQPESKPHEAPQDETSVAALLGIKEEAITPGQEPKLDKNFEEGKTTLEGEVKIEVQEQKEAILQEDEATCEVAELLGRSEDTTQSTTNLGNILVDLANSLRLLRQKLSKLEIQVA